MDCQEADIWRAVNGTWNSLLEDDREMAAGTVTPSKVVIYFKFNDFKSNEEDLQNVIRGLRKSHKDLYIFVVGPRPEIVEKFRADVKDAVVIIPQVADDRVMQRIASELAHEICQSKFRISSSEVESESFPNSFNNQLLVSYPQTNLAIPNLQRLRSSTAKTA